MSDELKPVRCGCGGEAVIYVTHWWGKCYVCECDECGTASRPCNTEAEAITAWNKAMNITHERAIDYLQSTGWMQDHDRDISSRIALDYDTEGDPRWRLELGTKDTHDENDDR